MIYTEMTKKALRIAFDAHIGQVDRTGLPYIFHPFHLAEQMHDEVSVCAALLHDVVEDTDVTFEDLAARGISGEVIDAVRLLTHDDDVPYMDYVRAIKESGNAAAIAVKLADLAYNSDVSRLGGVGEKDFARLDKYKAAVNLLKGQVG
jgi:(p)ppGpp synthase/HD superfamily hydrolase